MHLKSITGTIHKDRLDILQESLKSKGIKGISVSRITDWLSDEAEIKIYAAVDKENLVVTMIAECAGRDGL